MCTSVNLQYCRKCNEYGFMKCRVGNTCLLLKSVFYLYDVFSFSTLDLTAIGIKLLFHIFYFFFVLNFPEGARMAWNYDC
ncbi:hypothetical protein SFRURICE_010923 [Spodoptera frugiperda]|nr:hypothetical protein SFRURICE_010923 [Spodoptera frugiperda]